MLLLSTVFVIVNVSLLILRSDDVAHDHVTVPTVLPVLGATTSGALAIRSAVDVGAPFGGGKPQAPMA